MNDLERVTQLAEGCGATKLQNHCEENEVVFYVSELLAFEQAILAKRDERIAKLDALIHRVFETTVPYNEKGECVFCESVLNEWKELYEL